MVDGRVLQDAPSSRFHSPFSQTKTEPIPLPLCDALGVTTSLELYTVVSWVSVHGRFTITPDFQHTGHLPGMKIEVRGAYCSSYTSAWGMHAGSSTHTSAFSVLASSTTKEQF